MIKASTRLHGVEQLIEFGQYFVIHAARQSGKTTYLQDLTQRLNAEGKYYALYCSLETVQGVVEPEKGIPAVIYSIKSALRYTPYEKEFAANVNLDDYTLALKNSLMDFSHILDKPLVIFFDEADCLSEWTLISFLRQLRDGHNSRNIIPFVHSVALVGMRNIRDFKAKVRPDSESLGSASPFNIVTESLTLKNFTKEEIKELYQQHTDETKQKFEDAAVELVWEQTQGQPWLVNAIAREAIVKILQSDYTQPVTAEMVKTAIQTIILRRDVHIDSLLERLKEERVRRVIEPLLLGDRIDTNTDDFYYTRDLGLIRVTPQKIEPGNPIYAEVMVRTLNFSLQDSLSRYDDSPYQMPRYLRNGRIDMDYLMRDFQQFWRENSAIWIDKIDYREAAPHLILMAFLQRVINGGGQIIREMAAGAGRTDICAVYEGEKYPIELKIYRNTQTLPEGLKQTARYVDTFGCSEGWLAIFDQRPKIKWSDKLYMKKEKIDGKTITVVGL
jgi:type II secretory pathway predicted ATPase ExeA/Holliday junction resolvase